MRGEQDDGGVEQLHIELGKRCECLAQRGVQPLEHREPIALVVGPDVQCDGSQVLSGNAAEHFSVLRRMSLNLLKAEKSTKRSLAGKRKDAAWDNDYLPKVLVCEIPFEARAAPSTIRHSSVTESMTARTALKDTSYVGSFEAFPGRGLQRSHYRVQRIELFGRDQ